MSTERLTQAKKYIYLRFHSAGMSEKDCAALLAPVQAAWNKYLYWKPVHDNYLWHAKPEGQKFGDAYDLNELTADFEAELEKWLFDHRAEYEPLAEDDLWERVNACYLSFLLDRFYNRTKPICYQAEVSRYAGRITGDRTGDDSEAFWNLEESPSEGHLSGTVRDPETTGVEVEPTPRPFLPANEWLEAAGDWRFHLLRQMVGDPEQFEALMMTLAGETIKVPERREQKHPMALRLIHEHEGEGITQRLLLALGLHRTEYTSLEKRAKDWKHSGSEAQEAQDRYNRALSALVEERDKASRP